MQEQSVKHMMKTEASDRVVQRKARFSSLTGKKVEKYKITFLLSCLYRHFKRAHFKVREHKLTTVAHPRAHTHLNEGWRQKHTHAGTSPRSLMHSTQNYSIMAHTHTHTHKYTNLHDTHTVRRTRAHTHTHIHTHTGASPWAPAGSCLNWFIKS